MPDRPRADNPNRGVRIEDALWNRAKRIALAAGPRTSTGAIVRAALIAYCDAHERRDTE